ncbi:MAG: ABC transporter permease [Clostridia bacterium]|nr:ABC transporter permease [Clostridia bacterium]MBO7156351.1 ABC transporter permease [Clostridia bacterium]
MADTTKKNPLVRISKRNDIKGWKAMGIRAIAFVIALLIVGVVSTVTVGGDIIKIYTTLFIGNLMTARTIWVLLESISFLLLVSLAVTPAFKMRFWNIGAEGQALMGVLGSAMIVQYFGGKMPEPALLVVMFATSVVFAAVWAVIPAIFKAYFNTNETLFTLMMNYVAIQLVKFFIQAWSGKNNTGSLNFKYGTLPKIGNNEYILGIIIVAVITLLVTIYLKRSKHGYELSVVGESENTARYIGINVKAVIIRTMILSGVLCGVLGFVLFGKSANLYDTAVGGRGFTAILVSWLAKFNPIYMIGTSSLVAFLQSGAKRAGDLYSAGKFFTDLTVGIFFFCIIASEFFINYTVKFRQKAQKVVAEVAAEQKEEEVNE